jgi:5-methylcytosine-specific restriction endonuclease McrA
MSMTRNVVYGSRWRQVRLTVLQRDGWQCQIRGPRCTGRASDVDHIIDWHIGGALYDLENLRSVCRTCHNRKTHAGHVQAERRPSREW